MGPKHRQQVRVRARHQGNGALAYGQNLASLGATGDLGTTESAVGKAVKDQWYDKEAPSFQNFYGLSNPPSSAFHITGHFTQLVWKETVKVGCSTVHCPAGSVLSFPSYFTVCNYSPPGNYDGQYGSNVAPSLGIKISL
ncbi:hypothetical protein PWT90_09826 [Aphanocladium album]|nr:hypothetical protein PWT90_09826 [Aphanocladium album]